MPDMPLTKNANTNLRPQVQPHMAKNTEFRRESRSICGDCGTRARIYPHRTEYWLV